MEITFDCPERISNPTFNIEVGFNGPGSAIFQNDHVPNWFASHNSPHYISYDNNICNLEWTDQADADIVCLGTNSDTYSEGIFTPVSLPYSGNVLTYCLAIDVEKLYCSNFNSPQNMEIHVRLARNMIANGVPSTITDIPQINTQIIADIQITNTQRHVLSIPFEVNSALWNNIWIYATQEEYYFTGFLGIHSVNLTCTTSYLKGINYSTNGDCLYSYDFSPQVVGSDWKSFAWKFGDGTESLEQNPSHTFEGPGTYEVCLKGIDKYDACAEICTTLVIEPCTVCGLLNGYTYVDGENGPLSSQFPLQNSFSSVKWQIHGNLLIDVNATFNENCTFILEPEAQIIISSNLDKVKVDIVNSRFYACDKMWRGIKLSNGSTLYFLNNILEDAEHGIELDDNTILNCGNNTFDKCVYGIYSKGSQTTNINYNRIYGNQFICTSDLNDAYNGQVDYPINYNNPNIPDKLTIAGIRTINFGRLNLQGLNASSLPNEFKRIRNGVLLENSYLTSLKTRFEDLRGGWFPNIPGILLPVNNDLTAGIAISSLRGGDFNIQNNFVDNAFQGVYIDELISTNPSKILNSNFYNITSNNEDGSNAVFIKNSSNNSLNIVGNMIDNSQNGIKLALLQNLLTCDILNNSIKTTLPNFSMDNAINLSNINSPNPININNNPIEIDGYAGISALNSSKVYISDNDDISIKGHITGIAPNEIYSKGISLYNSTNCEVSNNVVFGDQNVSCLEQNSAKDNLFCCNSLSNGKYGYNNRNTSTNTLIRGNIFENSVTYGLYLRGTNSKIGIQSLAGNLWSGFNQVAHADNLSSQVALNRFFVNNSQNAPLPGATFWPITNINDWFIPAGGDNMICDEQINCGESELIIPTCGVPNEYLNELELIAQGQVIQDEFVNQNLWTSQMYLYNTLDNNSILHTCSPILQNYWNNPPIGIQLYSDFEKEMSHINDLTAQELSDLGFHNSTIEANYIELDNIIDDFSTPLDAQEAERVEFIFGDLSNSFQVLNAIKSAIRTRSITQALGLKNQMSTLPNIFDFHIQYKQIQSLALDRIIYGDEYLLNHLSDLVNLASLCDSYYGSSVYIADGLLGIIGKSNLKQAMNCTSINPRNRKDQDQDRKFKISPNPSSDFILVELSTSDYTQICLRNLHGVVLKTQDKPKKIFDSDGCSFDISSISNGVYLVEVKWLDGTSSISKFIKVN